MAAPGVALVGHPFGPIGIARGLRLSFASLRSVGIEPGLVDIYRRTAPDVMQHAAMAASLTSTMSDVNIFHLNGDEIEGAIERLGGLPPAPARNVVVPMWELPRYPAVWAAQLERFDEVWAASRFIRDSLAPAVSRPTVHMPLATEVELTSFLGRRYFGIPESGYAFLFFFDFRSFIQRKNPYAVIEAFRLLLASRPWAQACLVVKVHGAEHAPKEARAFFDGLADLGPRAALLTDTMSENEVHNLIRCCDAFVSLHRAEGYGLGLAEAMYLGLPVVGTGYSGNMDFMTPENSRLVGYRLVDVPEGAYPHAQGNQWADPDIEAAAASMVALLDDPAAARKLGQAGSRAMRVGFSYRAAGLRYLRRIEGLSPAA